MNIQKIMPCLWFDSNAEEAASFYTSLLEGSRVKGITRYGKSGAAASRMPEGSVATVVFELAGQDFLAINAGPHFTFSHAVSFGINCETQDEIDRLWEGLAEGGKEEECGWVQDKYGLSWQIWPKVVSTYMLDPDPNKGERVMAALLTMKKLDLAALERAYEGS